MLAKRIHFFDMPVFMAVPRITEPESWMAERIVNIWGPPILKSIPRITWISCIHLCKLSPLSDGIILRSRDNKKER